MPERVHARDGSRERGPEVSRERRSCRRRCRRRAGRGRHGCRRRRERRRGCCRCGSGSRRPRWSKRSGECRRSCGSWGRRGRSRRSWRDSEKHGTRGIYLRGEDGHVVRRGIARRVRIPDDDARGPLLCGGRGTGRYAGRVQEEVTARPRGHREVRPRFHNAVRVAHGWSRHCESGTSCGSSDG